MLFWTWAKRLEDEFDCSSRQNLRHFIRVSNKPDPDNVVLKLGTGDTVVGDDDEDEKSPSYYYVSSAWDLHRSTGHAINQMKHELARIQTCAIFHKLNRGRGVPHTFIGFIKQWPALPRVVVSVCR
jgi:KUP system potassium uptake protein